jgi:hypothetical protein
MSTVQGNHIAVLTDLNTVLPQPANNVSQTCLTSATTITYHYREATSRMMQNFSTDQSVDHSPTTILFPDGASRAPRGNLWMGPEAPAIATIYLATPLLSYQICIACLTMRLASSITHDLHDFATVPSEYGGPRSVP